MNVARRYNKGKLRYELLPLNALKDIVEVYTKGAEKYTIRDEKGKVLDDGANNWRKGLSWMDMLSSVERHIESFKAGEDIDPDLGTKHLANAAWGLLGLLEYYRIFPQGDDRPHAYLRDVKISLDIDDCICKWTTEWANKFNHPIPKHWDFSYKTPDNFSFFNKKELEEFYLQLPTKINPEEIKFNIHCYITSRSLDENITKNWIEKNGFPTRPIYTVGFGQSKVEAFKQSGADYHIDDSYGNFIEMSKAGITCFLLTTPHNEKFEVGFKRIKNFEDFKNRFL